MVGIGEMASFIGFGLGFPLTLDVGRNTFLAFTLQALTVTSVTKGRTQKLSQKFKIVETY
jgi:hypothetical protein